MPHAPTGRALPRARTSPCAVALTAAAGLAIALAGAPPALADDCPNATVRSQQHGTRLPECRAYELVSPARKNGNAIKTGFMSDPAGGGVTFESTGAFAGAQSSVAGQYYARRTDGGWVTRSYNFPNTSRVPWVSDEMNVHAVSDDLSTALLATQYPISPLDQGSVPDYGTTSQDVYRRHPDGRFDFVSQGATLPDLSMAEVWYFDATPDLNRVGLVTRRALTPEIRDESVNRLYVRDGDDPAILVSVGEDGQPLTTDSSTAATAGDRSAASFFESRFTASADLSRIAFKSDGRVLMRFDAFDPAHATTRPIVLSSNGTECTDQAALVAVSADGTEAVVSCNTTLTTDAPPGGGYYLRNLDTGAIRWIAPGTASVKAVNPDLSRIWLTDGSRFIVVRDGVPDVIDGGGNAGGSTAFAHLSASGEYLAVLSTGRLLPTSDGSQQVFRVSALDRTVVCVSCRTDGVSPGALMTLFDHLGFVSNKPRKQYGLVGDNGRVFFSTEQKLVPEDVNGVADAYEWVDGRQHLISSGTSGEASSIVNASADGRDVYFITSESLVPQDVDSGVADIYDARVDGGFAESVAAPRCTADCQGPPPADAAEQTPATVVFHGADDVDEPVTTPTAKVFFVQPLGAAARRALARGKSATLKVRVSDAGRVSALVQAKVGKKTVRAGSAARTVAGGGTVSLKVRLNAKARKQLRRAGSLRVTVRVTWSRLGGAQRASFVLSAPGARGGRR